MIVHSNLAARLAEIRATVAALTLDGRMPVGIAADLSDLLAAYDALAEAVLARETLESHAETCELRQRDYDALFRRCPYCAT